MYTIKQASTRTGLSIPTIRAWERRYGIVAPERTGAGYRLYDEAAIERLAAMRYLVEGEGWRPSQAAERVRTAGVDRASLARQPATAGPDTGDSLDQPSAHVSHPGVPVFVAAAQRLDVDGMGRVLDEAFASQRFELAMDTMVFPALRAVGRAWAAGDLDVAAEHAASETVRRRLARFFDAARGPMMQTRLLVGMPPAGQHELGVFAFAVACRRAGQAVAYLGMDVPLASWLRMARETAVPVIVLGAVTARTQSVSARSSMPSGRWTIHRSASRAVRRRSTRGSQARSSSRRPSMTRSRSSPRSRTGPMGRRSFTPLTGARGRSMLRVSRPAPALRQRFRAHHRPVLPSPEGDLSHMPGPGPDQRDQRVTQPTTPTTRPHRRRRRAPVTEYEEQQELEAARERNDLEVSDLREMSVAELRQVSRDLEVDAASGERKDVLVDLILQRQTERAGHDYATGILDIVDEGFGFLRRHGLLPSPDDVYVTSSQVRRFGLRIGDRVSGAVRAPREAEKYWGMLRVDAVNGVDTETARRRPIFGDLTPVHPDVLINLETDPKNLSQRLINLVNPIGKGQRALIVSPPKAGKTMLLKQIANGVSANYPEILLMVALIGERPEEVTDMRRSVKGEVISSTFDEPTENHTHVAEMALEIAKRQVETGRDVVILLDSITRLARAYNLALPPSRPDAVRWPRPDRALSAEALLRRRAEHRGGRLADDHRDLPGRHRLAHGRRHLRGVQGHRQLGAHPRPEARREADLSRRSTCSAPAPAARSCCSRRAPSRWSGRCAGCCRRSAPTRASRSCSTGWPRRSRTPSSSPR